MVQLFAELGLDTGYASARPPSPINKNAKAALELDRRDLDAPYVVKSPWICDYLNDLLLERDDIVIDHIIVPVRDLYAAAESQRDVVRRAGPGARPDVNGGLWYSEGRAHSTVLSVDLRARPARDPGHAAVLPEARA